MLCQQQGGQRVDANIFQQEIGLQFANAFFRPARVAVQKAGAVQQPVDALEIDRPAGDRGLVANIDATPANTRVFEPVGLAMIAGVDGRLRVAPQQHFE